MFLVESVGSCVVNWGTLMCLLPCLLISSPLRIISIYSRVRFKRPEISQTRLTRTFNQSNNNLTGWNEQKFLLHKYFLMFQVHFRIQVLFLSARCHLPMLTFLLILGLVFFPQKSRSRWLFNLCELKDKKKNHEDKERCKVIFISIHLASSEKSKSL